MNLLLSCAGHNLRLVLNRLRESSERNFVAQYFSGFLLETGTVGKLQLRNLKYSLKSYRVPTT